MFELSTYVAVVQKSMIIEGESEQYNRDKESKKRKAEFHWGSQVKEVPRVSLQRKWDFSKEEMWDFEGQKLDM